MAKEPRRTILPAPQSSWERTLENSEISEFSDRNQAGEIEPGREDGGGGDKGIDADTGMGGYGGDAAEAGHDEAIAQPDRPLDREIRGDPRTREGESYPVPADSYDDGRPEPDADDTGDETFEP